VTTVRIVFARQSLRAARAPDGSDVPDWRLHQRLIVLADTVPTKDGSHRGVPLWLRVFGHKELLSRVGRPAADAEAASGLLETAVRLLRTAGTEVSAVDIEPSSDDVPELRWDTVTARVGLTTATGTRPVTVSAEYGLALAATRSWTGSRFWCRARTCWRHSCLWPTPGRRAAPGNHGVSSRGT